MPLKVSPTAGTAVYHSPMVGPVGFVKHVKVDLSVLTTAEVDVDGVLKPGTLLTESGGLAVLVTTAAAVIFCVHEATKLAVTTPVTSATLAAETGDHLIAVAVSGVINRDAAEDNLGRSYTANEIASFPLAGTLLALTTT